MNTVRLARLTVCPTLERDGRRGYRVEAVTVNLAFRPA
jgi:hypothetical protein